MAATFLHPDFQLQKATQFAGRVFKRLMYYYTCAHPDVFLSDVTNAIEAFENQLLAEQQRVEETARTPGNARQRYAA